MHVNVVIVSVSVCYVVIYIDPKNVYGPCLFFTTDSSSDESVNVAERVKKVRCACSDQLQIIEQELALRTAELTHITNFIFHLLPSS